MTGYKTELFAAKDSLNGENFFKKDGAIVAERGNRVRIEAGRDPLDGSYYVDLKREADGNQLRAILTPEQAFGLASGLLVAMARWGFAQAEAIVKGWKAPR